MLSLTTGIHKGELPDGVIDLLIHNLKPGDYRVFEDTRGVLWSFWFTRSNNIVKNCTNMYRLAANSRVGKAAETAPAPPPPPPPPLALDLTATPGTAGSATTTPFSLISHIPPELKKLVPVDKIIFGGEPTVRSFLKMLHEISPAPWSQNHDSLSYPETLSLLNGLDRAANEKLIKEIDEKKQAAKAKRQQKAAEKRRLQDSQPISLPVESQLSSSDLPASVPAESLNSAPKRVARECTACPARTANIQCEQGCQLFWCGRAPCRAACKIHSADCVGPGRPAPDPLPPPPIPPSPIPPDNTQRKILPLTEVKTRQEFIDLTKDYSLAELKKEAARRQLNQSGTKPELVEKIYRFEQVVQRGTNEATQHRRALETGPGTSEREITSQGRTTIQNHKKYFNGTDVMTHYLYEIDFPFRLHRWEILVTLNLLRLHAVHTFLRQKNIKMSEDPNAKEKSFGTTKAFAQVLLKDWEEDLCTRLRNLKR